MERPHCPDDHGWPHDDNAPNRAQPALSFRDHYRHRTFGASNPLLRPTHVIFTVTIKCQLGSPRRHRRRLGPCQASRANEEGRRVGRGASGRAGQGGRGRAGRSPGERRAEGPAGPPGRGGGGGAGEDSGWRRARRGSGRTPGRLPLPHAARAPRAG